MCTQLGNLLVTRLRTYLVIQTCRQFNTARESCYIVRQFHMCLTPKGICARIEILSKVLTLYMP